MINSLKSWMYMIALQWRYKTKSTNDIMECQLLKQECSAMRFEIVDLFACHFFHSVKSK